MILNDRQTARIAIALSSANADEIVAEARRTVNSINLGGTDRYVTPRKDGKRGYVAAAGGTPRTFRTKREAVDFVYHIQRLAMAVLTQAEAA